MTDHAKFEERAAEFVKALNQFQADYYAKNFKNLKPSTYTLERGPKFIRVVENRDYASPGRSVYCFLDYNGNILKAASWKKPAKHIRGSIFDDNFSIGKDLTQYGAVYLK